MPSFRTRVGRARSVHSVCLRHPASSRLFVAAVGSRADELNDDVTPTFRIEAGSLDAESRDTGVAGDRDCEARVGVMERLLGRARADAELLREELAVLRTDSYEAP